MASDGFIDPWGQGSALSRATEWLREMQRDLRVPSAAKRDARIAERAIARLWAADTRMRELPRTGIPRHAPGFAEYAAATGTPRHRAHGLWQDERSRWHCACGHPARWARR